MIDAAIAPPSDVFISYKREERDVAERLAKFLTTRGYDVWWDAALLAGENFAKVVQSEVSQSRAVVVLWSKLAISSSWVRTEAVLALAHDTLINAIIDSVGFDEIPPEFAHIQAVKLADSFEAFAEAIALAIARKGTQPSQSSLTTAQAARAIENKVRDTEFFRIISNSSYVGDFQEYLTQFGENGQFSSLARRRISALTIDGQNRKSLWSKLEARGRLLAAALGAGAAAVAILSFLGLGVNINDGRPEPSDKVVQNAPTSASEIGLPISSAIFEFYPNTDFPGNDASSGIHDPSLNNLSATQCMNSCRDDDNCKVFVYNAAFKMCFLKYNWASPYPFKGAFSGVKLPAKP